MNTRRLTRNIYAFRNLIQRIDDGELKLDPKEHSAAYDAFHEVLDFHVDGWLFRTFFDGLGPKAFDYFDSAVAPDGQELGFDDIGDWYPERDWWAQ